MDSMLYSKTLDWRLENILLQKLHTRSHKVGGVRLQSSFLFSTRKKLNCQLPKLCMCMAVESWKHQSVKLIFY